MKAILTIITEEILKQLEGVGDRYAEKRFGIPDPDDTYSQETQPALRSSDMGELVGYTKLGFDNQGNALPDPNSPVFKNPKSLKNFEIGVRGFSDSQGNLYVGQVNASYVHGGMSTAVGLGTSTDVYDLKNGLTWQRVNFSNRFGLSDSSVGYPEKARRGDSEIQELFNKQLDVVRQRNPAFEFIPELVYDLKE